VRLDIKNRKQSNGDIARKRRVYSTYV